MPIATRLFVAAGAAAAALCAPAFAGPPDSEAFRERLAAAQGKLTVQLVEQLASSKKPMIVVSPASIAGAAATLDLGASGPLRTSLHAVLGFDGSADVGDDLSALRRAIDSLGAGHSGASSPLKFANAVVFDQGVAVKADATRSLAEAGIDSSVADLRSAESVKTVNRRVSERTGGMIPEIIDRPPAGASLVVLSALHFKDRWKTAFDRAVTRPAAFKRLSGGPATVATMHLPPGRYLFRQDAKFVGIELPYAQDRFSMVVVTTRGERPAPPRAFAGVGEWLTGKNFAAAQGELALPHFDVSEGLDLTPVLDRLGLHTARVAPGSLAGFSADPMNVTRIVQRLELRLNEEGTQAAGATAVIAERGVDPNYIRMAADKPFVFALRDKATGLILMAGYVGEPTSLATAAR
ncbi:MAG TPA: serpin family protein [Xanthobacteraceae bacterium]|nr:serpin family protein [Xanthobacteraceae bacterium]